MASWRKLHSKILDSPDFNNLPSDFDRLIWVLLPLCLDREGRGIDDAAWLKSRLFPLRRDVEYDQIEATMTLLAERHMLIRYEANDRQCFYVPTWSKYQSIHPHEPQSALPECPMKSDVTTLSLQTADNVTTMSPLEEIKNRGDVDGEGEERNAAGAAPPPELPVDKMSPNPTPAEVGARIEQPEADKPAVHPALQVWRDTHGGRYPHGDTWETIIGAVGDDPGRVARWKEIVSAYIALGWNPVNVSGMLDFFKRDELPAAIPKQGAQNKGKRVDAYWDAKLKADLAKRQQAHGKPT